MPALHGLRRRDQDRAIASAAPRGVCWTCVAGGGGDGIPFERFDQALRDAVAALIQHREIELGIDRPSCAALENQRADFAMSFLPVEPSAKETARLCIALRFPRLAAA